MYKKLSSAFFLIFFLIFFLFSCSEDENEIKNIDNPKLVAIAFLEAIYNEKDIEKAASVCTPKLSRLLLHYRTSQAVAKHLFNMSFEKVTDIKSDDTGVKVRERFKNKAVVTVYIEGLYEEGMKKDIKQLSLIQNDDDQWVIDEILKDPF